MIEPQILDILKFLWCLLSVFTEQYFRDGGVTLNERFSAPQKGGFSEEETEELTLDERFSSNRYVTWCDRHCLFLAVGHVLFKENGLQ